MFGMGIATHVGDGAGQKIFELRLFLLGEAGNKPGFDGLDALVHPIVTFLALWKDVDPLAPAVEFIGTKFDEAFLFQPGEQTGYGGVTQAEFFLNILGAGGLFAHGKKSHDMSLGRGQIHFFQSPCNGLVGTPVQDPGLVTVMLFQCAHLLNR